LDRIIVDESPTGEGRRKARKGAWLALQVFTLARIPLAGAFAALLLLLPRGTATLILCLAILVLVELTDLLDGIFARRFDIVTEWGAMLDPFADSMSRLIVFWALAVNGLVIALVPLAMALRDVTVAYSRIVLARHGRSVSARFSGKLKAVTQAVGGFIALLGPVYWDKTGTWTLHAVSWIVIGVTLFSVLEYARGAFLAATHRPDATG